MLPSRPTPPIALATPVRNDGRLATTTVNLDDRFLAELTDLGIDVSLDRTERLEASRDWWPQAMTWSRDGQVPAVAAEGAAMTPAKSSDLELAHQAHQAL